MESEPTKPIPTQDSSPTARPCSEPTPPLTVIVDRSTCGEGQHDPEATHTCGSADELDSAATGPENTVTSDGTSLSSNPNPDATQDFVQSTRTGYLPTDQERAAELSRAEPRPAKIANYEILGTLGRGGMGVVYKARQEGLGRIVALKMILNTEFAGAQQIARFLSEAQAIAQLQHPNIVQIYEIGEHNGQPFFSLEFAEGGSLERKTKKNPWPTRQAAELVVTLARAIEVAHRHGIIHRDLKPANILLTADDTPKITDFGLAKRVEDDHGQTPSGAIMGTPSYMAPEQAFGKTHEVGPGADIYSLGAILYELLTGAPPFRGATVLDTLEQVRTAEPVRPSSLLAKLPRDLETIVLKCLQKSSKNRYASAANLAEDLSRYLAGEPILARPAGRLERGFKWARRRPLAAALAAVSVLMLITSMAGVTLFALYQDQQRVVAENLLNTERDEQEKYRQGIEALNAGKSALALNRFENANAEFVRAKTLFDATSDPHGYALEAHQLSLRTTQKINDLAVLPKFKALHDDASFHWYGTQVTSLDKESNTREARKVAKQALDLFDIDTSDGPFLSGTSYDNADKTAIAAKVYELLLILAQATAEPLPGESLDAQTVMALGYLQRAEQLRAPTRAGYAEQAVLLDRRHDPLAKVARQKGQSIRDALLTPHDYFLEGMAFQRNGELLAALGRFDDALRLDRNYFWANFLSGTTYLSIQRPAEAKSSLSACIGQRPDFVWSYLLRAFAAGQLGAQALANGSNQEAALHFQGAEADFNKAESLPRSADAEYVFFVNRGVMRVQQKDPTRALPDFEEAIKRRPAQYQTYLNLAEAYTQLDRPIDARKQLDRVLELAPKLAAAYRARAKLSLLPEGRNIKAALSDLENAIAIDADKKSAEVAGDHKERGLIFVEQRAFADALVEFDAALAARADFVVVHRLRAEVLMELDNYAEAAKSWDVYLHSAELALAKFLQAKEPVANAYRARGVTRARLGQPVAALEDYNHALQLDENSATYAFRGWIYAIGEAPQFALRDFGKAIELDKDNGDAYSGRAWCEMQLSHYQIALVDVEESLRLGPADSRIYFNAARTFAQATRRIPLDAKLSENKKETLGALYANRAVTLLSKSLDRMLSDERRKQYWREVISQDSALSPIHLLPEYKKLDQRFGANLQK